MRARQGFRLFQTVLSNVAGYCECGKCPDQIALQTLYEYLAATANKGETVRDKGSDLKLLLMVSKLLSLVSKERDCHSHNAVMDPQCNRERNKWQLKPSVEHFKLSKTCCHFTLGQTHVIINLCFHYDAGLDTLLSDL